MIVKSNYEGNQMNADLFESNLTNKRKSTYKERTKVTDLNSKKQGKNKNKSKYVKEIIRLNFVDLARKY